MKKIIALTIAYLLVFSSGIFAASNEFTSFAISDSLVQAYDNMPKIADTADIFKKLDSRIGVYYMDRYEMAKDLQLAISDYPQFHRRVNNFALAGKTVTIKLLQLDGMSPEDSIIDRVWLTPIQMDTLKNYIRQEAIRLSNSPTISKFLNNMKGIVFADSMMMRRYALSLFAASLGVCYDTSGTYQNVKDVLWTDSEIEDLFRTNNKLPVYPTKKQAQQKDAVLDNAQRLLSLLNKRYRFLTCSEDRWSHAFSLLDTLYSSLLENIVNMTTDVQVNFSETTPITWYANDCGCSQYKELNGDVYAIYPYWLAKEGGDTLDFSVITRIAYYGLTASHKGKLEMPSGSLAIDFFNRDGQSEFVNVAHKHNVKVDWIIKKSEWGPLANDSQKMQDFFTTLINQIEQLVNKKNNSLFQRFVATFTLDGKDAGNRGDGVTLWFQNYPTDPVNTEIFRENFWRLQETLKTANEFAYTNLLMHQADLTEKINVRKDSTYEAQEKGIYSYDFFRTLLDGSQAYGDIARNFLIVLSDEPVSRSKLLIYHDLNQQLKGDNRTKVLHAVVPMLWLDYRQWDQLEDDASFYNDAYYSLGVAPYGIPNDTAFLEQTLANTLLQKFEKEDGSHERQGAIAAFFCTHRWAFRLLNTVVYALVFLLLICFFVNCNVNSYFSKHLALLVALVAIPPLLTSLILSNFDPIFMDYVGKVGQWGCFVVIILTVIAITLLQVYRSADFPKRNLKHK